LVGYQDLPWVYRVRDLTAQRRSGALAVSRPSDTSFNSYLAASDEAQLVEFAYYLARLRWPTPLALLHC
jgi:hypothetical protein